MSEKKSTESFIDEAIKKHGDKYDYTKVEYVDCKTKVEIICPIHGSFWQTPNMHLSKGRGCPMCGGTMKLNDETFKERAFLVHGNKYDYRKVEYVNNKTKVVIICPEHGEFLQTPNSHLKGEGCPICKAVKSRKLIYGVGIYDDDIPLTDKGNYKIYYTWRAMLSRCYSEKVHFKQPTYIGCTVCEHWFLFSNFKKFYIDNYVEGWCLDKDILIKGNKEYSPETCCFVPNEINVLILRKRKRSSLPAGVKNTKYGKFSSYIRKGDSDVYLGIYSTPEEAFQAYKEAKEDWIKEVANKWKDKLAKNVYEALVNYEVEITD